MCISVCPLHLLQARPPMPTSATVVVVTATVIIIAAVPSSLLTSSSLSPSATWAVAIVWLVFWPPGVAAVGDEVLRRVTGADWRHQEVSPGWWLLGSARWDRRRVIDLTTTAAHVRVSCHGNSTLACAHHVVITHYKPKAKPTRILRQKMTQKKLQLLECRLNVKYTVVWVTYLIWCAFQLYYTAITAFLPFLAFSPNPDICPESITVKR